MPEFKVGNFNFSGIAEGGIETAIEVKPLGLLFDIGKCPYEMVKVPTVLISHGHLDHCAGIPYYISQRALRNTSAPKIYVSEELYGDMDAILQIYSRMEGFSYQYNLIAVELEKKYSLNKEYFFKAHKAYHRIPTIGYTVFQLRKKLKSKYSGLKGPEIKKLKDESIDIIDETEVPLVTFSGDSKIEFLLENESVQNSEVLFLECTYIDDARSIEKTREWGHIHLDEIIKSAHLLKNKRVFLTHFSKRYSSSYIRKTLKAKLPSELKGKVLPFL